MIGLDKQIAILLVGGDIIRSIRCVKNKHVSIGDVAYRQKKISQ